MRWNLYKKYFPSKRYMHPILHVSHYFKEYQPTYLKYYFQDINYSLVCSCSQMLEVISTFQGHVSCALQEVTFQEHVCMWMNNMLMIVVRHLHNYPLACVWFPSQEKMQVFSEMVNIHYPSVQDVI